MTSHKLSALHSMIERQVADAAVARKAGDEKFAGLADRLAERLREQVAAAQIDDNFIPA